MCTETVSPRRVPAACPPVYQACRLKGPTYLHHASSAYTSRHKHKHSLVESHRTSFADIRCVGARRPCRAFVLTDGPNQHPSAPVLPPLVHSGTHNQRCVIHSLVLWWWHAWPWRAAVRLGLCACTRILFDWPVSELTHPNHACVHLNQTQKPSRAPQRPLTPQTCDK